MSVGSDARGEKPAFGLDPRVAASPQSYTGHYLKQVLKRRSARAKRAAEAAE